MVVEGTEGKESFRFNTPLTHIYSFCSGMINQPSHLYSLGVFRSNTTDNVANTQHPETWRGQKREMREIVSDD